MKRIGRHSWHGAEMTSRMPSEPPALQIVLDQVPSTAYILIIDTGQRPRRTHMASLNAYYAGRNAARHGGKCPFTEKSPFTEKRLREAWLAGYRRARAELNLEADTARDVDDPR